MSTTPGNVPDAQQFAATLAQIQAGQLYRAIGYTTFGDYAEQHCGISRHQAYRLIRRVQ
ncbi:hypothetical protein [Streptomyces sp. SD31]|uniref:hypothetical protein n=1 Tax=Streptomyces sp. SD31 TaxID=3452208 RepID=UPI003F888BB1